MKKSSKILFDLFDYLEIFVSCTAVLLIICLFICNITKVSGQSMENTLHDSDLLIVRNALYEPKCNDIVVIHDISNEGKYSEPLIKRIIAVGGQTIDIDFDTWTVTVDGEIIDEPYIKLDGKTLTSDMSYPLTVGENELFVMGDNRNHSGDSRMSEIGLVDKKCVVGKAVFRVFPFESFGSIYE